MYCLFINLFVVDGYRTTSFPVKNAYVPTCCDSEICTLRTKKGHQSLQLLVLCQKWTQLMRFVWYSTNSQTQIEILSMETNLFGFTRLLSD